MMFPSRVLRHWGKTVLKYTYKNIFPDPLENITNRFFEMGSIQCTTTLQLGLIVPDLTSVNKTLSSGKSGGIC